MPPRKKPKEDSKERQLCIRVPARMMDDMGRMSAYLHVPKGTLICAALEALIAKVDKDRCLTLPLRFVVELPHGSKKNH